MQPAGRIVDRSARTVRFAVVGTGTIGAVHAGVLSRRRDTSVSVLVSRSPDRARLLRQQLSTAGRPTPRVVPRIEDAFEICDAVVICTPSGLHADPAVAALNADKHTLIEKPLEISVAAAARVVDAARRATGVATAAVVSQHRFDSGSQELRRAIIEGRLGRVTSAAALVPWWRSQDYYDSAAWRGTTALDGGGALMNQGIHTLDLLVWLLGDPVAVYARSARLAHGGIDVEDTIVGTITFASGALATVLATTAAYPGLPTRLQVHGASGSAVIDNDQLVYLVTDDETRPLHSVSPTLTESIPRATESSADPLADALDRQYDDFLASARTGVSPLVTVVDAARTLAVADGLYRSARDGHFITLQPVIPSPAPNPTAH